MSLGEMQHIFEWKPADEKHISVATSNYHQILVAVGNTLHYFEIQPGNIIKKMQIINDPFSNPHLVPVAVYFNFEVSKILLSEIGTKLIFT